MSEQTRKEIENNLNEISKMFQTIVSKIDEIINFYFNFGWFFDYELPFNNHMYKIFQEENILLDGYMIMHYNDNIREIENLLLTRFPERSQILKKAFLSHKNQDYEISIPILLIQSDGIFREITGKELFSKNEKRRAELLFREVNKNDISNLLLTTITILRRYEELSASFQNYEKYPRILHRNLILHGYQNDYATEINAYKAISLINYVGKIIYDLNIADKNKK